MATRNKGKIAEIKAILADTGAEFLSLDDLPDLHMPQEKGMTFKINAVMKARFIVLKTRMSVIADDSGLEVDSLGMRPGIHSARYAGAFADDKKNIEKLLEDMKDKPVGNRTARFRCVIAYAEPGKGEIAFEGALTGEIAMAPKGENGFGYDPVFLLPSAGKTLAELTPDEKNAVSHRALALKKLKKWFDNMWSEN